MKKSTKKQIVSLSIVLVFMISSFSIALTSSLPSGNSVQTDWVALIRITVNGEIQTIPAGIGVNDDNSREKLFTADYDGRIYKTGSEEVTLGDFFSIWGVQFNSECVLEYCNTNTSSLRVYVNNVENYAYNAYVINNRDVIQIDYR